MIVFRSDRHKLQVMPSAKEPSRFDWSITRDDVIVRQSARSFDSEGASETNGDLALRRMTVRWQGAR